MFIFEPASAPLTGSKSQLVSSCQSFDTTFFIVKTLSSGKFLFFSHVNGL
jgi:hypothetical protein